MKFKNAFFPFFMFAVIMLSACANYHNYRLEEGLVWNTAYRVIYNADKSYADSILKILEEIDYSLSVFNENSIVSAINKNKTDTVDAHFKRVYEMSKKINTETNGMFDPTLSPLITAWGFGKGHAVTSDTMKIDSLLNFVGISKTKLEGLKFYKENPEIEINFSAVAKGYGVDCIADMFVRNGITDYLIEIGGEIRASGTNREGKDWVIGVDKPDFSSDLSKRESIITINISGAGVATSGNYRNYHQTEGKTFGHTISPLTGRPVATDIISATVVAPTAMEADALATSCMALGSEESLKLCDKLNRGVMLILKDYSIINNSVFDSLLR